ncbi:hypothetical protein BRW08_004494 [Escherichia coli]|nr:hypothetical protein [Escherichia coli]EFD2565282.1 hypothetical protein [Escherichia coli]EFG1824925.1 hypothetical protein [Escherichia coli]
MLKFFIAAIFVIFSFLLSGCDNKDDACIKNKNDVNCISEEQKEKYFKEYLEKTSSLPSSNKE